MHRATRVMDGLPAAGGPPQAARHQAPPLWPGITTGCNALCSCTWAMRNGTYQVKVTNAMCTVLDHRGPARGMDPRLARQIAARPGAARAEALGADHG